MSVRLKSVSEAGCDPLALQQVEKHMNQLFVIDGVSVRRDFDGRYCLNDLHRAAEVKNVTSLPTGPVLPKRKNSSLKFRALLELQERPRWSPLLVVLTRTFVCKELVYSMQCGSAEI
jgi:hypothetical protein